MLEFNVSGGVSFADSDTLYVDNGNSMECMTKQWVCIWIWGLGLSSALIPSSNTVTSPEASIIVDSQTTVNTLDGTVGDVKDATWIIELSEYNDVFIGRDAVYDSATNSYDPGNEVIIATYGYDMIDGGGGLNTADFFQIGEGYGIDFNMNSGSVNIDEGSYHQNWHGFQIARGTAHSDTICGNRDNDNSVPEDFMHIHFGTDGHVHSGAGTNILVGNGGGDTIYGNVWNRLYRAK